MRRAFVSCACAAALLAAASADAGTVSIGPPQPGNSWYQQFVDGAPLIVGTQFDFIGIVMRTGTLESPGIRDFSGGPVDWPVTTASSPNAAFASGSATSSLYFWLNFEGSSANPVEFDAYAFLGQTQVDHTLLHWDGSSWSYGDYTVHPDVTRAGIEAAAVPMPATASMGLTLMGAMGVAGYIRKRRVA